MATESPEDPDFLDENEGFAVDEGQIRVSMPRIPAEMVNSIALGMEDELVVAARHGFSFEEYQRVRSLKAFQVAVEAQRAEFQKNGLVFKVKRAMQADDLFDDIFVAAKGNATLVQKLQVAVAMARLGGLEPKEDKSTSVGPSFQINIDLGGAQSVSLSAAKPAPVVIENGADE